MPQRVHRILVVLLALSGCDAPASDPGPPPVQTTPPPTPTPPTVAPVPTPEPGPTHAVPVTPELEKAAVQSINDLTIALQRKLLARPGNVFASGASVALGLAMVHAGSGGKTARELEALLHLGSPGATLYPAYAGLAARWSDPEAPATAIVGARLFGAAKLAFTPAYTDLTRDVFAAPIVTLDLLNDPTGARAEIDAWARAMSRGALPDIVPGAAVTASTRLVLASAGLFKAEWLEPFDPAATTSQPFFGATGKRSVAMMRGVQRLRVAFGKAGKIRVLEVPYKGGQYSMVLLLPGTRGGLAAIEKGFDAAKLQSWIDAGKETAIDLQLPRFTLDETLELAPTLHKLGAATLFDGKRADLGAMALEKTALSGVYHRAKISVEERGEQAVPAHAIDVSVGGAPANPTPFHVDRPFLFYIRDVRSGALLFFGRVTDPPEATAP